MKNLKLLFTIAFLFFGIIQSISQSCCPGCERISNGDFETPDVSVGTDYDNGGDVNNLLGQPFAYGEVSCWDVGSATPHILPISTSTTLNHCAFLGAVDGNPESSIYTDPNLTIGQYYKIKFKYYPYNDDTYLFNADLHFVFTNNSSFIPPYSSYPDQLVEFDMVNATIPIPMPFTEYHTQNIQWITDETDCFLYNGGDLYVYPHQIVGQGTQSGAVVIDDIEFELCPQYEITHTCTTPVVYSVEIQGNITGMSIDWPVNDPSFTNPIAIGGTFSFELASTANQTWSFDVDITETACNGDPCTETLTINGNTYYPMISWANTTNVTCNGGNDGEIDLYVYLGTIQYSFLWDNLEITEDISGLIAGDYEITITDSDGCETSSLYTITQPTEIIVTSIVLDATCFGYNDGSIDISVSGGILPYSYSWSNFISSEDQLNIEGGTYVLTITDSNGCIEITTIIVQQPDELVINSVVTNPTCLGGIDGSIELTLTGGTPGTGTPGFLIWWDNNVVTEDQFNLSSGIYEVMITESNGCVTTESYTVQLGPELIITSVDIIDPCRYTYFEVEVPSSNILNGTAPFEYVWNTGTTQYTTTVGTINLPEAGFWDLTITDANGCIGTHSFVVSCLDIELNSINTSCFEVCDGNSEVINATYSTNSLGAVLPLTYIWSTTETTSIIDNLCVENYTVTVTDDDGFSGVAEFSITSLYEVTLGTNNISETCPGSCDGEIEYTIVYNPTQTTIPTPFDFVLTNSQSPPPFSGNSLTDVISNQCSGPYDLMVTDNNGCSAYSNGNTIEEGLNVDYEVLVSDCSTSTPSITINLDVISSLSGILEYQWSTGAITSTISVPYIDLPNTYVVTITDQNGAGTPCTVIETINVVQPPQNLTLLLDPVNPTCDGINNGEITAIPSGGNPPYTYYWSTGETTPTITGLSVNNTYYVTITDVYGCEQYSFATMNDLFYMEIELDPTPPTCEDANGNSDPGSIDLIVSNGTEPIEYQWSNNEITQSITGLSPGLYSVVVTDANNCILTASEEITPTTLLIDLDVTGQGCDPNNINNGEITTTITGGASPYTYLWDDPSNSTSSYLDNLYDNSTFTVTVTDANLCYGQATTTIMSEQEINLPIGWSIMSTYIDLVSPPSVSFLNHFINNGLASEIALIKDDQGQVCWPAFGVDLIISFTNGKGYQINMYTAQTWHVEGNLLCPEEVDIPLSTVGINMIAYLRLEPLSAVDVFLSIATDVAIVKDGDGVVYWPAFSLNNIGNMNPGEGYSVRMNNANTLTYTPSTSPYGTKSIDNKSEEVISFNIFKSNELVNTGNSMVIGLPIESWDVIPQMNDEIGVFGEHGQLVGREIYKGGFTAITIFGDDITTFYEQEGLDIGESFTISVGNYSSKSIRDFNVKSWKVGDEKFETDKISIVDSHLKENVNSGLKMNIFPNPGNGIFKLDFHSLSDCTISIQVINNNGQVVHEITGLELSERNSEIELDFSHLVPGLYNILLNSNSKIISDKLLIIR